MLGASRNASKSGVDALRYAFLECRNGYTASYAELQVIQFTLLKGCKKYVMDYGSQRLAVSRQRSAYDLKLNVTPSPSANPQYANVDAASDTVGDLAIAKFRCDCNPCRVAVMQMLQTGQ